MDEVTRSVVEPLGRGASGIITPTDPLSENCTEDTEAGTEAGTEAYCELCKQPRVTKTFNSLKTCKKEWSIHKAIAKNLGNLLSTDAPVLLTVGARGCVPENTEGPPDGQDERKAHIGMCSCKGSRSLDDFLKQESVLSPLSRVRLAVKLLEAVDWFHEEARFVHSDLKPANVLVCPAADGEGAGPTIKLIDFDMAMAMRDDAVQSETEGYPVAGTMPYVSPYVCSFVDGHPNDGLLGALMKTADGSVHPLQCDKKFPLAIEELSLKQRERHPDLFALGVMLVQDLLGREPEGEARTALEAAGEILFPFERREDPVREALEGLRRTESLLLSSGESEIRKWPLMGGAGEGGAGRCCLHLWLGLCVIGGMSVIGAR